MCVFHITLRSFIFLCNVQHPHSYKAMFLCCSHSKYATLPHILLLHLMIHHMPLRQLFRHILYADARVCHQNHGMVTQVCQLVDRFVLVFLRCRDDNLGTLLADLFQNLVQTFVEQVGGCLLYTSDAADE